MEGENIVVDGAEGEPKPTDVLESETVSQVTALEETVTYNYPQYTCDQPWVHVCESSNEFKTDKKQGFLKGCKWSPDGTCLLTCADDNTLRLFDLPADLYKSNNTTYQGCSSNQMNAALKIKEGELIYDYCWHPHMSSWHPETCLLASTAKNNPVHLWDAYHGKLMATYRAYNNVDEVEAAISICISPDGEKLYCGFDKCVRIFDVKVPGRECETRPTKHTDGITASQSGIISCIAVNPALPSVYAAASYMKTIGLYSEPDGVPLCVLEGHRGGVTQVKFSADGLVLYSGGRKDSEIICWDLRNPGNVLFTMKRTVETNQRIYFDLDPSGRYLITGNTDGYIKVFDTQKAVEISPSDLCEMANWKPNNDCTNGISCHPWLPLVATTSGQRHLIPLSGDSDSEPETEDLRENSVKLWWVGPVDSAAGQSAAPDGQVIDITVHEEPLPAQLT